MPQFISLLSLYCLLLVLGLSATHCHEAEQYFASAKATLPGLEDLQLYEGLEEPTNIAFCPDGRIFIPLKAGQVVTVEPDGTLNPNYWLDISTMVEDASDKGLIAVVCDPNFLTNQYVYVLYAENRPDGSQSPDEATQGVLARYTEINGVADPNSRFVLIGDQPSTGFIVCGKSHTVGDLAFGRDGTLFASSGDGARWEWDDDGTDKTPSDASCAQMWGKDQDIGAFRAQNLNILAGKIIRIDPATGNGIGPDNFPTLVPNPYYDAANPASTASRVWALGYRNEFRISVRQDSNIPGPGVLYVADVGYTLWEEINVVRKPGGHYGWPCLDGDNVHTDDTAGYYAMAECASVMQTPQVAPLLTWHHMNPQPIGFTGDCAAGAVAYTGTSYPAAFIGDSSDRAVFVADYGGQWIRVIWVDENDNFKREKGINVVFKAVGPICSMKADPVSGDIFYVRYDGEIHRIVNSAVGQVHPPVASIQASPIAQNVSIQGPMTVNFSSDGSIAVDVNQIWMHWDFGDGTHSYEANPSHTYTSPGIWTVTLTVLDSQGITSSKQITIKSNQAPPVAKILTPEKNTEFSTTIGQTLTFFNCSATDPDTPEEQLQYHWEVRLVHINHYHTNVYVSNNSSFEVDLAELVSTSERNSLEVYLTVTDPNGNSGKDMIRIRPANMQNTLPVISYTLTPTIGTGTLTVTADSQGTVDGDNDMMHHTWDWGDGTSYFAYGNLKSVHTYSQPGTYPVVLTVSDPFDTNVVSSPTDVTVQSSFPELALFLTFDDLAELSNSTKDCSPYNATVIAPEGIEGSQNGYRNTQAMKATGKAINVSTPAFTQIDGQLSISVFVKLNGSGVIVSNKQEENSKYGFQLEYSGGAVKLWGSGSDSCTSNPVTINDGKWHRISAVANDTFCGICVDDTQVTANATISPIKGSNDTVSIGSGLYGEIDQLAIYLNFFNCFQLEGFVDNSKSCNRPEVPQTEPPETSTTTTTTITTGTTSSNNITPDNSMTSRTSTPITLSLFLLSIFVYFI